MIAKSSVYLTSDIVLKEEKSNGDGLESGPEQGRDEDDLPDETCANFHILVLDAESKSLASLIRSTKHSGCDIRVRKSIDEILKEGFPGIPTCLILGQRLPDDSDPFEVLGKLRKAKWQLPVVFVAREWSLKSVIKIMRAGANDILTAPVDCVDLNHSLTYALDCAAKSHGASMFASGARARVSSLNKREKQIVQLVIKGLLNKEIADHLGLALITVKVYRANAMKKLEAGNPAQMVKIAVLGGLELFSGKL